MLEKHISYYLFLWIMLLCTLPEACTDLTDVENDIKDLQTKVTKLEDAVSTLQTAYDSGKVIKSVESFTETSIDGWNILFSDNSSIQIKNGNNGKDGLTPILKTDANGYWCVSYDNGMTVAPLYDSTNKQIRATGEKGNEGISVRVKVNSDGLYTYETYYASSSETVIEAIVTPYTSHSENVLSSIIKDEQTKIITLTMADGTSFAFNMDVTYPTGIILLNNKLSLGKDVTETFEFRVNPSNALLDINVEGGTSQVALDKISSVTRTGATSYITTPRNYKLIKIEPAVNDAGKIKVGQYKAYVQDTGKEENYNEQISLVISTKDGAGNNIQLSSSPMEVSWGTGNNFFSFNIKSAKAVDINGSSITIRLPYGANVTALTADFITNGTKVCVGDKEQKSGKTTNDFSSPITYRIVSAEKKSYEYLVTICYSSLPTLYITTPQAITSKDDWVKGSTMIMTNTDNTTSDVTYTDVSIKGRGNSTWSYPKKPYAIKLDKKTEILGMPKHKRWALLANWMDRTLLRNAVAFEIARNTTSLEWTPRGQFVEVVLNGIFKVITSCANKLKLIKTESI